MLPVSDRPVSKVGAKVTLVPIVSGVDHGERPPPRGDSSAIDEAILPAGTIPAIAHAGRMLSEPTGIGDEFGEASPRPPLLQATPAGRARVQQRLPFHDERLEAPSRALFPQLSPDARDAVLIEARGGEIAQRLAERDGLTKAPPFALGERVTLAATSLAATLRVGERMLRALGRPRPEGPRARARQRALETQVPIATTLAADDAAVASWPAQRGAAGCCRGPGFPCSEVDFAVRSPMNEIGPPELSVSTDRPVARQRSGWLGGGLPERGSETGGCGRTDQATRRDGSVAASRERRVAPRERDATRESRDPVGRAAGSIAFPLRPSGANGTVEAHVPISA